MERASKAEKGKRVRTIMEWLIQDWPTCDIVAQCQKNWELSWRQSMRYIAVAREQWVEQEEAKLKHRRQIRIQSAKKLKQKIDPKLASTPAGINALLRIEKHLATLEGVTPSKRQVEAMEASDTGAPINPLNPTSSTFVIEIVDPTEQDES